MAYHPQTYGKAKKSNKAIFTSLWHYVAKRQKNWDTFLQALTYVYKTQIHRLTKETPSSLVLSRHPPRPTLLETGSVLPSDGYAGTSLQLLRSRLEESIRTLREKADANKASAQQRYKPVYDRQARVATTFQQGNLVFINQPSLATTLKTDSTQTALNNYNNLVSPSLRPFCVVAVLPHSLVLD